ncbi:hypothetical protein [Paenibacillus sp. NPDC057934]|uniref:hypothetical protein n=1 Tax=Paenibacillus sp. NPDC057934 TaxID=3346282 RepID=UPI0036DED403
MGAGFGAGMLLLLLIGILFKPLAAIGVGWIVGVGLKLIAGPYVAGALSKLLHTSITASMLPQVFVGVMLLSVYIFPSIKIYRKMEKLER